MVMAVTRAKILDTRLVNHFHDAGLSVTTPEPTWWWTHLNVLGPYGTLGIGNPIDNPDTGEPIVVFCPPIIDEQSMHYNDAEFDRWINTLQTVLDSYLIYHGDEDNHELVVCRLQDNDPAGLEEIGIQLEMVDFRYAIKDL